jgi:AraC-like DNA-binding protein
LLILQSILKMTATNDVASGNPQVFHFSTDDYRKHERVAVWSEVLGRHCGVRIDVNPRSAEDFRQSARIVRASTFGLIEGATSPIRQESSRSSVVNDDVTFCSVMTSRWNTSQLGRSLDLHPGDWSLLSNSDVSVITVPECRHMGFTVPRAAIKPLVPDIGATFARRIPASSPASQMLMRYLDLVRRDNVVSTPELAAAFTDHVCDLLALALGATRDAAELARTRGVSAARLQAMKDDIRESCHRPDLSVHTIAARHGVSVRYVQRIFGESGATFTAYLTEQRLAAAYKALRRRTPAHVPVSSIAYDCGFADVSHFNRVFRQRFGCTPTDVRNAARSRDAS